MHASIIQHPSIYPIKAAKNELQSLQKASPVHPKKLFSPRGANAGAQTAGGGSAVASAPSNGNGHQEIPRNGKDSICCIFDRAIL